LEILPQILRGGFFFDSYCTGAVNTVTAVDDGSREKPGRRGHCQPSMSACVSRP